MAAITAAACSPKQPLARWPQAPIERTVYVDELPAMADMFEKRFPAFEVARAEARSADWELIRNKLSGTLTGRRALIGLGLRRDGGCYYALAYFGQEVALGEFGPLSLWTVTDMDERGSLHDTATNTWVSPAVRRFGEHAERVDTAVLSCNQLDGG